LLGIVSQGEAAYLQYVLGKALQKIALILRSIEGRRHIHSLLRISAGSKKASIVTCHKIVKRYSSISQGLGKEAKFYMGVTAQTRIRGSPRTIFPTEIINHFLKISPGKIYHIVGSPQGIAESLACGFILFFIGAVTTIPGPRREIDGSVVDPHGYPYHPTAPLCHELCYKRRIDSPGHGHRHRTARFRQGELP
jgi:hypothetical protein